MSIRRKLFLFIPLLVLLMSSVSFFLFESGKNVQESYHLMMKRILLYKEVSYEVGEIMRAMNRFIMQVDTESLPEVERHLNAVRTLRADLDGLETIGGSALPLVNYRNIVDTFLEQAEDMIDQIGGEDSGTMAGKYIEAEQTQRFIREEAQELVDLELEQYKPIYQDMMYATDKLNRLGIMLVVTAAAFSILLALWLSSSITGPIRRLVATAKQISKGRMDTKAPESDRNDEISILCRAFNGMIDNIQRLMAENINNLEKDRLVKELELKTLQSQINPHFLFNTLNSISKLAYIEGAPKTSDLAVSVSRLLRYNLQKLDQAVPLREEVQHVSEYMNIQKARFRDRIKFELDVDERALDGIVPCLTLQPILENAFVHGIEQMEEGALLQLAIRLSEEGKVEIEIRDNGAGMSRETVERLLRSVREEAPRFGGKGQSTGLGTHNVFKRLHLFFDGRQQIDIDSKEGAGTTVKFTLPYRTAAMAS
ncbi:MAG: sensor histidine kinase [Paenibacillus macerans]|uniref:histidine kinase n=1 Tax=Paenibacillus macerans TaxID=44252 RepID=A0A090ZNE3_PAEMA|nr:sensor histidine kinase [Paenibacillus macerans]KFN05676.1 HAMP domain protein [Paenibacillus macerans]MBS5912780.1 sensor histidine kinase [Paenibacillus macerans]MCY7557929.1 sensor histidine kinase [Paenibacillus macerans]MDU7474127.1 sensor histidine kinase [Paenibacillus macerans]MEC0141424.1 sensor histidine kinase [Paenibacillus macerans]